MSPPRLPLTAPQAPAAPDTARPGNRWRRLRQRWSALGPGLITGAADDDPSGIATYTQAGAQMGYGLLWTVVLTWPLMVAIQSISARIGHVSGQGLASAMRQVWPRWLVGALVLLLVGANTLNIAADLAAMGEAMHGLGLGPSHWWALLLGGVCVVWPVFLSYTTVVRWLKWLTLSLLAYVLVSLWVKVDWRAALWASVWPFGMGSREAVMTVVALLGTTLSPYLFFWQAAQEAELRRDNTAPWPTRRALRRIAWDTRVGMLVSNLIAWFVVVAAAGTLHASGITQVDTTAQAAQALRPLAGDGAYALFTLGILGTGLLAVPVLAGSAAYAVAELAGWPASLSLRLDQGEGRGFYGMLGLACLGGVALCFTPSDPMQELYWAAVANGVAAVPLMVAVMALARKPEVMRQHTVGGALLWLGWLATGLMAVAVALSWWPLAAQ
jgi:NRAMP (natural resistance-associated macrophage protein)-like metal ion transporter